MKQPDERILKIFERITRNEPELLPFIEESIKELSESYSVDTVQTRWNEGRRQELQEIRDLLRLKT